MNLFPQTPKLSPADRRRINPRITNAKECRAWLARRPRADDIKRAVMLEVESGRDLAKRPVINILLVALQKEERLDIRARILRERSVES